MIAILSKLFSVWGVWVVAAVLAVAGLQTLRLGYAETKYANLETRIANRDAERERERGQDLILARQTESELTTAADTARQEKNEAIKNADRRVAAIHDSLRNRTERPQPGSSGTTPVASAGAGATGAGLYREDGFFLAGEAAAAAQIGLDRDQCYVLYSKARDALKAYGAETSKP